MKCLLSTNVETAKSLLRDYVSATIGFDELGGLTDKSPKSLMRTLSATGNPHARNLFEMTAQGYRPNQMYETPTNRRGTS